MTMTMPVPVTISPELTKKLRKLEEGKRSVSQMIQMLTTQAEQRISQYNSDASKVWEAIGKETGIDLINVLWVPHPTENKVVPSQINLSGSTLSTPKNGVD